ncbi:MAG: FKBP-type peptidyl-prolyl cis-trans isomerase [Ignavibacteriales bacterium]
MNNKVRSGDIVKFSFVGRLEDGSIFETTDEPISVEIGRAKLIRGLDKEILGMAQGEEKEITVSPEEGYGLEDPSSVSSIPLEVFENNNIEPEVGMMLRTSEGDCYVTDISDKGVEVTYNHPLAGKTLTFDVKIEEVITQK